ncbi:hypothetical protein [Nonomuraea salmonea]|uniref:Uncharacterized protein n=1 Tax=Nonomuraea salmonea TaxID=46181 RepID=A0ABV5P2P8_9ACTN
MSTSETVAQYEGDDSRTYEIDHLGIGTPSHRGEYAVYCEGQQVADFMAFGTLLKPECQPPLPSTPELIAMAKQAVREAKED